MDPAWPHLQGIYEFFLQLVINESVEVKCLKVYVTPQFVQEFLDLFDSEESVERDYLKNILHKLYAKVSNSCNVEIQRVFCLWPPRSHLSGAVAASICNPQPSWPDPTQTPFL